MPPVTITAPVTVTLSVDLGSASVIGRSAFHQLIYVDDMASTFFNVDEFAENVRYYHSSLQAWQTYPALFDDPHTSFSMGPETEVTNVRPQIMLNESTMLHVPLKGDKCTIRGITYYVDDSQKDGVGVTTIFFRIS